MALRPPVPSLPTGLGDATMDHMPRAPRRTSLLVPTTQQASAKQVMSFRYVPPLTAGFGTETVDHRAPFQ